MIHLSRRYVYILLIRGLIPQVHLGKLCGLFLVEQEASWATYGS